MDLLGRGKLMVNNRTLSLMDMPEVMNIDTASVMYPEIDPKAENMVEQARIQNLLLSPSAAIRSRGGDPDKVWATGGKGHPKKMREAGIPEEFIQLPFLETTDGGYPTLEDSEILKDMEDN